MPVRSINSNKRSLTGRMSKGKSLGEAYFESSLERDFLLQLEFNPLVISYSTQPLCLTYYDGDQKRKYTPDVFVVFSEGCSTRNVLYEVKFHEELHQKVHEYQKRFGAAALMARSFGWKFRVTTEREIRTPYLANCRFLNDHRQAWQRGEINTSHCEWLLQSVKIRNTSTPKELIEDYRCNFDDKAELLFCLWQLVATHQLYTDLSVPLTMRSILCLPRK